MKPVRIWCHNLGYLANQFYFELIFERKLNDNKLSKVFYHKFLKHIIGLRNWLFLLVI